MTARPPIAQFGDAIEVKVTRDDRAAAWPFRPSCYKDSGDTKTNWMLGLYDRSAPQIAAFARHRTSTALPLAHPAAPQGEDIDARKDDIRRNIIRQLGGDPYADRIILQPTDWDLVLAALAPAAIASGREEG